MDILHVPVMMEEVLEYLDVRQGGSYIDCTLGDGGHAEAILEANSPDGRILGIDKDLEAIRTASRRLARFKGRVETVRSDFGRIKEAAGRLFGSDRWDGILLDLGVSARQLARPERGFAFSTDGPLDMRMDPSHGTTASDLVNGLPKEELIAILKNYGEEKRWAKRIAQGIIREREKETITRTGRLARIITDSIPARYRPTKTHPATRAFQAIRIAVNGELKTIEEVLPEALDILRPGGRLVVISFHSLEDRIVKRFFAQGETACVCPPKFPHCVCGRKPILKRISKRVVCPRPEEIKKNPKARSAKLRAAEKL